MALRAKRTEEGVVKGTNWQVASGKGLWVRVWYKVR